MDVPIIDDIKSGCARCSITCCSSFWLITFLYILTYAATGIESLWMDPIIHHCQVNWKDDRNFKWPPELEDGGYDYEVGDYIEVTFVPDANGINRMLYDGELYDTSCIRASLARGARMLTEDTMLWNISREAQAI